jgi:hypothetical protein
MLRLATLLIVELALLAALVHADCASDCGSVATSCDNHCKLLRDNCSSPPGGCDAQFAVCTGGCNTSFTLCVSLCSDSDSDGVPDEDDSLIGNSTDVQSEGLSNLTIEIGGLDSDDPLASGLDSVETVTFIDDGKPVVEFEQDFSVSQLDLSEVVIKKEEARGVHGIVVQGLNLTGKTLFVDKRASEDALCIKDADIDSISRISRDCTGIDEVFFGRCSEGETIGGYRCSIEDSQYKIEGMAHSGAVEMNISGYVSGFFTVDYLNTLDNHKEGYLMPGEGISICYESARPILPGEFLTLIFVPGVGGLSRNEVWTPEVINAYNMHIYP